MKMADKHYLFTSNRLGFRNWLSEDIASMCDMNMDAAVMEFFPAIQTPAQTKAFIDRMQKQFEAKGFCYFAVDRLDNHEFIGFIGISEKDFEADFTPCIDLGWRIKQSEWNKGFATEGAKACIAYAFNTLGIKQLYAMAPKINIKSEQVMKKAGMQKVKYFNHPLLTNDERLQECILYEIISGQ